MLLYLTCSIFCNWTGYNPRVSPSIQDEIVAVCPEMQRIECVCCVSLQQCAHSPHTGDVSCLKNKGCHYETNKNPAHHSSYKTQKGSQKGVSGTLNVVCWKNRHCVKVNKSERKSDLLQYCLKFDSWFCETQTDSGKWIFNLLFWWGIIVDFFCRWCRATPHLKTCHWYRFASIPFVAPF